jgi:hypothetical protein
MRFSSNDGFHYALSHDGQRILAMKETGCARSRDLNVVLNWPRLLAGGGLRSTHHVATNSNYSAPISLAASYLPVETLGVLLASGLVSNGSLLWLTTGGNRATGTPLALSLFRDAQPTRNPVSGS